MIIEAGGATGAEGGDTAPQSRSEKASVDQKVAPAYDGLPVELLLGTLPPTAEYGQGCFVCHRPFEVAPKVSEDGPSVEAADVEQDERSSSVAGTAADRTRLPDVGVGKVNVERTEEDVIPKWLLKSLGLGNARAAMPNGQLFRYGHRKVPCCLECNRRMAAALEQPVSEAFRAGRDGVLDLDVRVTLLWLAKIYYGTRFRETGLRLDVAVADSGSMLEHEDLVARNEYLRLCLNHRPEQLRFTAPPASIFVFRAGVPEANEGRFDFFIPTMSDTSDMLAIRAGEVFVIAVFGDNGFWAQRFGDVKLMQAAMTDLVLHPVQCTELMMWFAAELAGHDSSGRYDMMAVAGDGGIPLTWFVPRFTVERNGAPQELLNRMRVASWFTRSGSEASEDVLARAANGRFATTLVNAATDELVQADCFELGCLDLFRRAGWDVRGKQCAACGAA